MSNVGRKSLSARFLERAAQALCLRPRFANDRTGQTGWKKINLALQGGGAHGAFTWGVLDHLLTDGRLTIEGITGASAGAVNAVLLAGGVGGGGREGGRKRPGDI